MYDVFERIQLKCSAALSEVKKWTADIRINGLCFLIKWCTCSRTDGYPATLQKVDPSWTLFLGITRNFHFSHFFPNTLEIVARNIHFLYLKNIYEQHYNLRHNISELYNVLIQTRLTASKTKHDIEYSKLGIQVASRVAERLKN